MPQQGYYVACMCCAYTFLQCHPKAGEKFILDKNGTPKQAPAISEYQRIIQKPLKIFSPDKDRCKARYTCYGSEGGTERNFALKAWNRA